MNVRTSLTALAVTALLGGCMKPNNASIEMVRICYPPDAGSCSYSEKCGAQYLGNQIVDIDMTGSLFLAVEVQNQLPDNKDESSGRGNTNNARVQQVEVSYSGAGFAVGSVTNDLQQAVPANGTAVLGLEILGVGPRADFLEAIAAGDSVDVIANVTLKGVVGGSDFETGAYRVPITVCRGCLASAFVCADPAQSVTAVCPNRGQWPAKIACGEGPATYTVGGAVTNLTGSGLVVTCNGTDYPVAARAVNWKTSAVPDGTSYVCLIGTQNQPSGQSCTIANANGTISAANITNVNVTCAP